MSPHMPVGLSLPDLRDIEIAIRLRVESCEDDGEMADRKQTMRWKVVHRKVEELIKYRENAKKKS